MNTSVAFDIDVCVICGGLYFPGDDLVVSPEGEAHDYCFEGAKKSEKNLALNG